MSIGPQKSILIIFVTVTTVLALVSCYTLYIFFGVVTATRMMARTLSLLKFDAFTSDNKTSLRTDVRIHNPSEFTFQVTWASEKLYNRTYTKQIGRKNGYFLKGVPVEVPPFANVTLTIFANDVLAATGRTRNLYLSIAIGLDTPLPSHAKLKLGEEVSFTA